MFRWLQAGPLIDEVGYVVAETRAMGLKKRKADDKPGGTRVGVAVLIACDGRGKVEPHTDPA